MGKKSYTIAVDFDGTIVTNDFPNVIYPVPYAIDVLKKLINNGHRIILFTCRSGKYLNDALDYLIQNRIKLYGVNRNPSVLWGSSPKVVADLYIDDLAIGCPLILDTHLSSKPYVDWVKVEEILKNIGLI